MHATMTMPPPPPATPSRVGWPSPSVRLRSALTTPRRGFRCDNGTSVNPSPVLSAGDRFIPNRRKANIDEAHFQVVNGSTSTARHCAPFGGQYQLSWSGTKLSMSSTSSSSSSSSATLTDSSPVERHQSVIAGVPGRAPPPPPVVFSPTKTFDRAAKSSYRRRLAFLVNDDDNAGEEKTEGGRRVLSFSGSESRKQSTAVVFSTTGVPTETSSTSVHQKSNSRHIPHTADKILDLPLIVNDFYSTVITWGCNNEIAVALDTEVFKWNSSTGLCTDVPLYTNRSPSRSTREHDRPQLTVTAVAWDPRAKYLAIGFESSQLELWDNVERKSTKLSSTLCACEHAAAIYAIVWNSMTTLFSASGCGCIVRYDVTSSQAYTFAVSATTELLCALAVSADGRHLAVAGNSGVVRVYDIDSGQSVRNFKAHGDTIKAMAWCPWQPNVLATAGGFTDGRICIWKNSNGSLMSHVDTKSQVCSMVWAPKTRELITGHGRKYSDIIIWKYPNLEPVARLRGHQSRVIGLVLSPCGSTIASCAGDELLMLWKCFDNSSSCQTSSSSSTSLRREGKAGTRSMTCRSPFVSSIR